MRAKREIVLRAMVGARGAFEEIVRIYGGPLYAFCLSSTRDRPEAEDAVQDIFMKAFSGLGCLRDAERFESWLYAIARKVLASRGRARAREPGRAEAEPDELAAERPPAEAGDAAEVLGALFGALSREQAAVVALRYGAGLSVAETALACGIDSRLAKSRLHEALERMRRVLPRSLSGRPSGRPPFRIPIGLEERIMESVETLRLGASVIERMAIYDQTRLAALAVKGERMDEELLGAMGRINGGTDFLRRVGAKLAARELGAALSYASRETEARLIEELERVDPATAELVKKNSFVFEDFSLFDEAALELFVKELGASAFAQGLSVCEKKERDTILGRLGEKARSRVAFALRGDAVSPKVARAAQEEAVALMRTLELEGRIRVFLGEEAGPSGARVSLA